MASISDGKIERVKISEASKPKEGMFSIYIDDYWAVTDDDEILIYGRCSPQCHHDESMAIRIHGKLYPECSVRQLPIIYIPLDPRDY